MTVYRPKSSPYFHYDFQFKGQRYHGSTGCEAKRAAESYERDRRTEAALGIKGKPSLTIDEACGLYWQLRAQHEKDQFTTKAQLARLTERIGKTTRLEDVSFAALSQYVARRRGDKARNKATLVTNATVNREIELLRRVTRLSGKSGYEIPDIDWGALLLKEAQERIRELSADEEQGLLAALPSDLAALAEFAMLAGQRRTSIITLLWSKVDLRAGRAEVLGKGNLWHQFPLTPRMVAIIANRPKGCAQVFTYECERPSPRRNDRPGRAKGERYPFSRDGWRRKWAKALEDAGIDDFRFHDLRHTAGSRVLRASGNLKVVQKLLNHSNITTTARYAHALEDDVRNALLATESRNSPDRNTVVALKLPKKRGN